MARRFTATGRRAQGFSCTTQPRSPSYRQKSARRPSSKALNDADNDAHSSPMSPAIYVPKPPQAAICGECEGGFTTNSPQKRYCSRSCALAAKRKTRVHPPSPYSGLLAPGAVGALNELKVSADLIERGYHVFRALSSACDCDLAILKDERLLRIEVTTGYQHSQSGKLYYNKHKAENYDHIAVVCGRGDIFYEPALPPDR